MTALRRRFPPAHRATTAHLQAVYPFLAEADLGCRGVYLGRDLYGGAFCFDPWELYQRGTLTSPNLLVVGQIGRGKSSFVKSFVWRQAALGRLAWVVDPKGEYGPLAEAFGVCPVKLEPGGSVKLNPLDAGGRERSGRRQAELLCTLAATSLERRLRPAERSALEVAVSGSWRRNPLTLTDVIAALLDPDPGMAASLHCGVSDLISDSREVALELRRLVEGDLAGMFDGPTSPGIDLNGPLVVLDLSAVYASPALGILMACATGWLQASLGRHDGAKRLLVVDEAWAILHSVSMARWLQAVFKLSRSFGVANIAVLHRLSDLSAAGAAGTEQSRLAEGLLADSETRVIFGQPPSEIESARKLLGLSSTEAEVVAHLPKGMSLWKVGLRSFVVEHRLSAAELRLVDTDSAMRDGHS